MSVGPLARHPIERLERMAMDDPGGDLYAAAAALALLTDAVPAPDVRVTETDLLAALAAVDLLGAPAALAALLEALPPAAATLVRSARGLDLHVALSAPSAAAALGVLSRAEEAAVRALAVRQVPRYPGVLAGDVEYSRRRWPRAGGAV